MKKIFIIGLLLIIATSTLGVVAATESVADFEFNIPDGFEKVNTSNYYDSSLSKTIDNAVYKKGNEMINITIQTCDSNSWFSSLEPGPHFEKAEISGYDGIYTANDPISHIHCFEFISPNGSQLINIEASSKELIQTCLGNG